MGINCFVALFIIRKFRGGIVCALDFKIKKARFENGLSVRGEAMLGLLLSRHILFECVDIERALFPIAPAGLKNTNPVDLAAGAAFPIVHFRVDDLFQAGNRFTFSLNYNG